MSKLKFNERGYKDVQLMQLAEQIHTKMGQDTTLFPAPVPELAVVVQRAGAKGAAAKRRTILLVCCVEFKS